MNYNIYLLLLVFVMLSCKEDPIQEPDNTEGKKGVLILNEGIVSAKQCCFKLFG